jgi:hypothetical protein
MRGTPCSVGEVISRLDDDDLATLNEWLDTLSEADIWQSLRSAGHAVSLQQIGRHRRGVCRCFR